MTYYGLVTYKDVFNNFREAKGIIANVYHRNQKTFYEVYNLEEQTEMISLEYEDFIDGIKIVEIKNLAEVQSKMPYAFIFIA